MGHLNEEALQAYVRESLAAIEREGIETHLASCELCLEKYFNIVDQWTLDAPSLSEDFTDQTIDQILTTQFMPTTSETKSSSSSRKRSTLLHYSIAAGLTIFLMFTGVFQQLFQAFDEANLRKQPSISNQIIKHTDKWIDEGIQMKGEGTDE